MKKALTIDDIFKSEELIQKSREFYRSIKLLKVFGNYCNQSTFEYLLGDSEGKRLWHCFVIDAKRDIYNFFLIYLNDKQMFILASNIIDNKDLELSALKD